MGKATLGAPGRTPTARVKWAIRFVALDLDRLSEQDRHRAWATLLTWQRGRPGQARPVDDGVPLAQAELRQAIGNFAAGLPDMVWVPETGFALFPPPRQSEAGRRDGIIRKEMGSAVSRQRVEPAAAVFALVDDLNAIGADRLRLCELGDRGGPTCGVIFLSSRRQLFCTPKHAQAAAWIKYEPTRKEQRT